MDFAQLRIFLVLADERTFLGAAKRLATSRSRVRRKLDQLELDAGTPLFTREASGLRLTAAGESLARRGRALLEDAEQLIAHVREVGGEPTGLLRIALPFAPTPLGWNERCCRAQERFPKLRVEFVFSQTPEALLPGRADLALSFARKPPSGCSLSEVGEYPLRLMVSDAYRSRHGAPESIDALGSHRIAVWRVPSHPPESIPLRSGGTFELEPSVISQDPVQLHQLVLAGHCIAYLPVLPQLADPALEILLAEEICGSVREWLVVPDILADVPRVKHFVAMSRSSARPDG